MLCRCHWHCTSTQLNSSLLTKGSRMAKRNTVHKNKSNDQSEWDKNTIKQTITWLSKTWKVIATVACMWTTVKFGRDVTVMAGGGALWWRVAGDRSGTDIRLLPASARRWDLRLARVDGRTRQRVRRKRFSFFHVGPYLRRQRRRSCGVLGSWTPLSDSGGPNVHGTPLLSAMLLYVACSPYYQFCRQLLHSACTLISVVH